MKTDDETLDNYLLWRVMKRQCAVLRSEMEAADEAEEAADTTKEASKKKRANGCKSC
jgi:hypothetical protein